MSDKDLRQLGFTDNNVSSIGGNGRSDDLVGPSLLANKEGLERLFALGFNAQRISNMLCQAGAKCDKAVVDLIQSEPILQSILRAGNFSVANVYSVLAKSAAHIGATIRALAKHEARLGKFIKTSAFSATDIVNVLGNAGKHLEVMWLQFSGQVD